jgi:vacuolar-type H+-ATPase subunit E/Vma4
MSAEKIIERIKKDSEKEINLIYKDVEKQKAIILETFKKEATLESEKIISSGKNQAENIKKILISKVSQDTKREIMKEREKIINKCFTNAQDYLSKLKGAEYKNIVKKLIEAGLKKIDGKCTIIISRDIDKELAEKIGLKVGGKTEATGGIILKSSDDKITLDYTFEGLLKRKKDEIRIKVGKLLFPE